MLGSGNICAFKIPTHRHSRYVHITWNSTPEWIACASIKSGRRHRLITLFTLRRLRPVAPYSRRDVSATMDAPLAFRAQASYENRFSPTTQVHRVWPHSLPTHFS